MRWPAGLVMLGSALFAAGCEEGFDEQKAREQLRRDVDAMQSRRGVVVYDFESVTHPTDDIFADEADLDFHWTLTIYTSGNGSVVRLDATAESEPEVITVLWLDDGRIMCSTAATHLIETPTDPAADVCVREEDVRDDFIAPTYLASHITHQLSADVSATDVANLRAMRERRLLNREAHCYRYDEVELPLRTLPPSIGGYEECFTQDGILARVGPFGIEQVSYTITAVSAGDVNDADFDLPYPIVDPE